MDDVIPFVRQMRAEETYRARRATESGKRFSRGEKMVGVLTGLGVVSLQIATFLIAVRGH